jgi:prepilin-type N-terminal cleavage/methylation domain-containing protein
MEAILYALHFILVGFAAILGIVVGVVLIAHLAINVGGKIANVGKRIIVALKTNRARKITTNRKENMMNKSGFTLIELMFVFVIMSILVAIAIPNYFLMQVQEKEVVVKNNCRTVQLTAEDFAVQNNGVYANRLNSKTPSGQTMIDLLPGGVHLVNPFEEKYTEPRDWNDTDHGFVRVPGDIIYTPIFNDDGVCVGCTIIGRGADRDGKWGADTICTLTSN